MFFSYHTLTVGVAMSDQQQFVLRWHYHESTLVHNLPYFLDGDILTDVTLSVGSQEVKAHKIILAMCSVYFMQLFQELKSTHPVVILHNVNFEEVKAILSFMYRGQCVVSQDQLPSLLSVAKLLKIQGLCDMKVPEPRLRNDILNEPLQMTEKVVNDENFHKHSYDSTKRPHNDPPENIYIKRHFDNGIPVQDYSENYSCKPSSYYDDKALPVPIIKDSIEPIPLKFDDTCPFPRKFPTTKDSSETCKCFLCGKYLSNQYNLRVHMETHEEAYHACQSCPHVSRSRDALRKHVAYRHPEEYHNRKRKKIDS